MRVHRRQHLVILLLPLAVAVHEHGKVARREGRLPLGDRVERDARVGENLLAIAPRDLDMLGETFGCEPLRVHARCRRPDLVLRLEVDPLSLETAMIDARIDIELSEPRVDVAGPALAPLLEQLGAVPVADLGTEPVLIDARGWSA